VEQVAWSSFRFSFAEPGRPVLNPFPRAQIFSRKIFAPRARADLGSAGESSSFFLRESKIRRSPPHASFSGPIFAAGFHFLPVDFVVTA
jgi:hypothetical protein